MSTDYTNRGNTGGSDTSDNLNFGSARSDYGSLAYGGELNKSDSGSGSTIDYGREYSIKGRSRGGYRARRDEGEWLNTCLTFLAGMGLGAALMYIFDPERGRSRRAYLSDKVTSAANETREAVTGTARDLSNRAQGALAEAGITSPPQEQKEQTGAARAKS